MVAPTVRVSSFITRKNRKIFFFLLTNIKKNICIFNNRLKKQAGILAYATAGIIPPMSNTSMEVHCALNESKTIYPFRFRVHTHGLGRLVTGYRVRNNNEWTMLGQKSPLLPQFFYPIFNTEPILPGDIIASRCFMESNRTTETNIGLVKYSLF